MNRPGDWNCRSCSHLNFQRRDSCQRCGDIRPDAGRGGAGGGGGGDYGGGRFGGGGGSPFGGGSGGGGGGFAGPDVRPGDWYCAVGNCGAHNFASRSSCFKCGVYKEESGAGMGMGMGMGGGGFDGDSMGRARGGFGFGGGSAVGSGGGGSSRSGWKSGDWICTRLGCNEHNFASRTECFRCSAPRDSGSKSPY